MAGAVAASGGAGAVRGGWPSQRARVRPMMASTISSRTMRMAIGLLTLVDSATAAANTLAGSFEYLDRLGDANQVRRDFGQIYPFVEPAFLQRQPGSRSEYDPLGLGG